MYIVTHTCIVIVIHATYILTLHNYNIIWHTSHANTIFIPVSGRSKTGAGDGAVGCVAAGVTLGWTGGVGSVSMQSHINTHIYNKILY